MKSPPKRALVISAAVFVAVFVGIQFVPVQRFNQRRESMTSAIPTMAGTPWTYRMRLLMVAAP